MNNWFFRRITKFHFSIILLFLVVIYILGFSSSTYKKSQNIYDFNSSAVFSTVQDFWNNYKDYLQGKNVNFTLNPKNSDEILMKTVLPVIENNNTYLAIHINTNIKNKLFIFIDGKNMVQTAPSIFSSNPDNSFVFYKVDEKYSGKNIYIYGNSTLATLTKSNEFLTVGTPQNIILNITKNSFYGFVFSLLLLLISIFIVIVFYITGTNRHYSLVFFSLVSILLCVEIFLNLPYTDLILNKYVQIIDRLNLFLYCSFNPIYLFIISLDTKNKLLRSILKFFILTTAFIAIFSAIPINYYFILTNMNYVNFYFFAISILSLFLSAINIFKYGLKATLNAFIAISLQIINILFFSTQIKNQSLLPKNYYYIFVFIYIVSIFGYILEIFLRRNFNMAKVENELLLEQKTIEKLHYVKNNNSDNYNIETIVKNIASEMLDLFPNYIFCAIVHEDKENNTTLNFVTDKEMYTKDQIINIIKKSCKEIETSSYSNYFYKNCAYITFKSQNSEILYVYIEYHENFTNLDDLACKILSSSLLSKFNNFGYYGDISATEKLLLMAIGKIIYKRRETAGNCELVGEYCKIIALSCNFDFSTAYTLSVASYIHNIGEIGLPEKFSYTNNSDIDFMEHTRIGYEMLSKMDGKTMNIASLCALEHHERFDGNGYFKKSGEDINIYARIVAVAYSFDIFCQKMGPNCQIEEYLIEGFKHLSKHKNSRFDPTLVDLFIKQKTEIGELIKEFRNK